MTRGELAVHLEQHGMRVRPRAGGFQAQCPAHNDRRRKRALSVSLGRDGRQLIWCHHCRERTFDAVRSALDLPAEAFFGWGPFRLEILDSRRSPLRSSVTLIICGSCVLAVDGLFALEREGKVEARAQGLPVPPRGRRTTRAVAADLGRIFALADQAGVGDVPLMYSTRWAAKRLGVDHSGVARALLALTQHGAIERAKNVPSWHGRSTRTYRRAAS
jgi:hypothetical protein